MKTFTVTDKKSGTDIASGITTLDTDVVSVVIVNEGLSCTETGDSVETYIISDSDVEAINEYLETDEYELVVTLDEDEMRQEAIDRR